MTPKMMRLVSAMALGSAVACGGGGNSASTPTSPTGSNIAPVTVPPNTVLATDNNQFNPTTLTVTKGTQVTFTFGTISHNVIFSAATGVPANIDVVANTSVTRTFSTVGSFGFDCTLHSGMHGTVVVN